MATIEIYRSCERCNGTGKIPRIPLGGGEWNVDTCPDCKGSGKMLFADSDDLTTRLDDLESKVDDIMNKCNDIFEKLNE